MEGIDNCNPDEGFDWSEVDIMSVIDAANIGDKQAQAELARREKAAGITNLSSVLVNLQNNKSGTVTPKFSIEEDGD